MSYASFPPSSFTSIAVMDRDGDHQRLFAQAVASGDVLEHVVEGPDSQWRLAIGVTWQGSHLADWAADWAKTRGLNQPVAAVNPAAASTIVDALVVLCLSERYGHGSVNPNALPSADVQLTGVCAREDVPALVVAAVRSGIKTQLGL